ncbi:precorrin-6B methylase 2 [Rhodobium orientis]|uniref:Methyltransferase domain-containing protein n=1 Tax=Rhodobium orientis TaxID=34017 RepID=A0A327JTD5_9HYPH|nr:class I SAM-dependent methyltransferase [Rhodobium orientis]MBB4304256.1 precorrin-6B methylase 2 [Rhodobium orientis]MBK5948248.1 hypothetical protein [Rhodobium orientis]RAI28766.1 hypothetical protein CH339_05005 [Rhodobium orientis]
MPSLEGAYERHARNCDEQDFWRQVRRTINGQPVPEDQIQMIIREMISLMDLESDDVLLDICCGNGALSTYFWEKCSGGLGIDYSETLIGVAQKYFCDKPSVSYRAGEAIEFLSNEENPERFSKAVIFGSICLFTRENAERLLKITRDRFVNIKRFVIGNVVDRTGMDDFYKPGEYEPGMEDRPDTAIGVWWWPEDFSEMAKRAGWRTEIVKMPEDFYQRHYRFDAILRPM